MRRIALASSEERNARQRPERKRAVEFLDKIAFATCDRFGGLERPGLVATPASLPPSVRLKLRCSPISQSEHYETVFLTPCILSSVREEEPCLCPKKFTADSRLAPSLIPMSQACSQYSQNPIAPRASLRKIKRSRMPKRQSSEGSQLMCPIALSVPATKGTDHRRSLFTEKDRRSDRGTKTKIGIRRSIKEDQSKRWVRSMKTKTWTVISNSGKQADLESGLEKREFQKPTHISPREFVHWLKPQSHVDEDSLRSLFKL